MVVGVTLCSWRRGPMELRLGARAEGDDQLLVVRAPPRRRLFHRLCVESCNVLLEVAVVLLQLGRAHRECPGVVRRLCARQDNRVDERGHVARRLETVSHKENLRVEKLARPASRACPRVKTGGGGGGSGGGDWGRGRGRAGGG